jgi:cell wall-associated NlpC family hydrolase
MSRIAAPKKKRTLERGASGKDVQAVQRALQAALRAKGQRTVLTPTGAFGDGTFTDMQTFQRSHGIEASGAMGQPTLNALWPYVDDYGTSLYLRAKLGLATTLPAPLAKGSSGDRVRAAQQAFWRMLGAQTQNVRNGVFGQGLQGDIGFFAGLTDQDIAPDQISQGTWECIWAFMDAYAMDLAEGAATSAAGDAGAGSSGGVRSNLVTLAEDYVATASTYTQQRPYERGPLEPVLLGDCSGSIHRLYQQAGGPDPSGNDFDGSGYCFLPEARVLTADLRWRAAGEVEVGDVVWGFDDERDPRQYNGCRRYRRARVVASFLSHKSCVRVRFDTGESLVCSTDQPWLALCAPPRTRGGYEWRGTERLVGLNLVRPFLPWTHEQAYEAGWLAGMFDGEGHIKRRASRRGLPSAVGVTQAIGPTADRLVTVAERYGSWELRTIERPGIKPRIDMTSNGGGMTAAMEFLGRVRPERLIANMDVESARLLTKHQARVVAVESAGMQEVQSIQTTSGTYFAEGFAVHNTGTMQTRGTKIALTSSAMAAGDCTFYGDQGGGVSAHTAMYLGNDRLFTFGSEPATITSFSSYWRDGLRGDIGARRYF